MFVYDLSGCGFMSSCCHLNVRFRTSFKQRVPWHSGNYSVWIHSENAYVTWQEDTVINNTHDYFMYFVNCLITGINQTIFWLNCHFYFSIKLVFQIRLFFCIRKTYFPKKGFFATNILFFLVNLLKPLFVFDLNLNYLIHW